ncbi:hypothetical protein [Anaerofustis sp.]|nr:hypothetical protein [Anaerofustis sp.]
MNKYSRVALRPVGLGAFSVYGNVTFQQLKNYALYVRINYLICAINS